MRILGSLMLKPVDYELSHQDRADWARTQFAGWKFRKGIEPGGMKHEDASKSYESFDRATRVFVDLLSEHYLGFYSTFSRADLDSMVEAGNRIIQVGAPALAEFKGDPRLGLPLNEGQVLTLPEELLERSSFGLHVCWMQTREATWRLSDPDLHQKQRNEHVAWDPRVVTEVWFPDMIATFGMSLAFASMPEAWRERFYRCLAN